MTWPALLELMARGCRQCSLPHTLTLTHSSMAVSGKREQQGAWFGPSVPGRLPKAVISEQRSQGKADINW